MPNFCELSGYEPHSALPAMVSRTGEVGLPGANLLAIRPVTTEADARRYAHLCAVAFGDPLIEDLTTPAMFDGERVRGSSARSTARPSPPERWSAQLAVSGSTTSPWPRMSGARGMGRR